MTATKAYAATSADKPLGPHTIERREPGASDVEVEIQYCGVCHSDLHSARGEWGNANYPMVPGHEIVGRVSRVGASVTGFKPGDLAAVGVIVNSCGKCASCTGELQQYCEVGPTGTYNAPDKIGGNGFTFGGYSQRIVTQEKFVYRLSDRLDAAAAAPLLCAGITTYSPLKHWKAGPGKKVGVVGLGGLGHMGVKFAHAFGATVVLFTTSPGKTADGKRLGADEVVISKNADEMARHKDSFDIILDTVSAEHDLNPYLQLLKLDGTLVMVGLPEQPPTIGPFNMIRNRRSLAGSMIGGVAETQEMLDFCAEHDITADIELIPMDGIEDAYARMLKSDVKYRFVIDMKSLAA